MSYKSDQEKLIESILNRIPEIICYEELKNHHVSLTNKIEIVISNRNTCQSPSIIEKILSLFYFCASVYSSLFSEPIGVDVLALSDRNIDITFITSKSSIIPKFLDKMIEIFLGTKSVAMRDKKIRILIGEQICNVIRLLPPSVLHNTSGNPLNKTQIKNIFNDLDCQIICTDDAMAGFGDFFCFVTQYTSEFNSFIETNEVNWNEMLNFQNHWHHILPSKIWQNWLEVGKKNDLNICFVTFPGRVGDIISNLKKNTIINIHHVQFDLHEWTDCESNTIKINEMILQKLCEKNQKTFKNYNLVVGFNQTNTKIVLEQLVNRGPNEKGSRNLFQVNSRTIDFVLDLFILIKNKIKQYLPSEKINFCCKKSMNGGLVNFMKCQGFGVCKIGSDGIADFFERYFTDDTATYMCIYKLGNICIKFSNNILKILKLKYDEMKRSKNETENLKDYWFFQMYELHLHLKSSSAIDFFFIYLMAINNMIDRYPKLSLEVPHLYSYRLWKNRSLKLTSTINERFLCDPSGEFLIEPKGIQEKLDYIKKQFENVEARAWIITNRKKKHAKFYAEALDSKSLDLFVSLLIKTIKEYDTSMQSFL